MENKQRSKQEIRSVELGCKCNFLQCNFWSRDVHPVQNLLLCTKFIEIRWLFTKIWRFIDFQNGGRPPSWNCLITIQDHPRSLCGWPQLPVKFHINLVGLHRSEETVGYSHTILFFRYCNIPTGVKWRWGIKNRDFRPIFRFISEMIQYRGIVSLLWNTNRNPYAMYRMVPFLIALNDI